MSTPTFPRLQIPSSNFVESCGAVLFDHTSPSKKVCLIHYVKNNEWLLPKGRRNMHEHRCEAATREVTEETGYPCRLHPITMSTRAPAADSDADVKDEARTYPDLTEPFMLMTRPIDDGASMKIIWWFVAVLDGEGMERGPGEKAFEAEFWDCGEAVKKLTFESDREVLERAIGLIEGVIV
jgi:8-oxo-dGTP pyrophosphatase MutT (NUDIX family)